MAEANISNSLSLKLNDLKLTTCLLDLPNEVLAKIFSKLRQEDVLRNVARVCKRFLEITRTKEVLPIIRIYDTFVNPTVPRRIQNCMRIYPRSKIELGIRHAEYSKMKSLGIPTTDRIGTVASFVKYMSLGFVLDNARTQRPFPKFENLEFLWLNDIAEFLIMDGLKVRMFWSHFPNLRYLYFNVKHILRGLVSFLFFYYCVKNDSKILKIVLIFRLSQSSWIVFASIAQS